MTLDIDREIAVLDKKISEHRMAAECLTSFRCELLAEKENIEYEDVIEYATELGIHPKRLMMMLTAEANSLTS